MPPLFLVGAGTFPAFSFFSMIAASTAKIDHHHLVSLSTTISWISASNKALRLVLHGFLPHP
jgi:hypothetical protein